MKLCLWSPISFLGTGKSRLQMSDSDLHIKSAEIAGHIAPTKNYTALAIITIRHTYIQYYRFHIFQKVVRTI